MSPMKRNSGQKRQDKDFYPTPAWVTETLLRYWVCRPSGIWEPCCGDGSMARVLEAHGHRVVATDLVDRGYGEGGRDFMLETRLPDGVTAIVTNPPYGDGLFEFIVHALKLTQPDGGQVAALVNHQFATGQQASKLCWPTMPAHAMTLALADRIDWSSGIGVPAKNRGNHNHCWLVWDWSRPAGPAWSLHVRNPEKAERSRRRDDLPEWLR
jgi:hypothetical protein